MMTEFDTPRIDRWTSYEMIAASSSVAALQHVANQAATDIASLIAAGEIDRAAGASMVMVGAMLLRAAAPSGSEGVPVETDLAIKEKTARKLNQIGATVAAAMVRAAVALERSAGADTPPPSRVRT